MELKLVPAPRVCSPHYMQPISVLIARNEFGGMAAVR
jgi:hypothetical protein